MIEQRKKKVRRRKRGDAELEVPRQATNLPVSVPVPKEFKERERQRCNLLYSTDNDKACMDQNQKDERHQKDNVYPQAKLINLTDKKKWEKHCEYKK